MYRSLPAVLLILAGAASCGGPRESNLGQKCLIVSDRGGAFRIYEVDLGDGAARLIGTEDASDRSYQDSMPARLPDGRIVFVSDRGGRPSIYLAGPAGRDLRRLTGGPADAADAADSAPAPLGADRIVFARSATGSSAKARRDLCMMRLDGKEIRRLTRGSADHSTPAGSADGRSVLFVSDRSGAPHLELMPDVDATDPEASLVDLSRAAPIPPGSASAGRPFADGAPIFLPDRSIVFSRAPEGDVPHLFHLGIVAGAPPGLRQITDSGTLPYGADEPVALGDDVLLLVTGGPAPPGAGRRKPARYAVYRVALGGFNLSRVTREQARYDDFTRRLPPDR